MATFNDVSDVETALNTLSTREDGPFVVRLARLPGRRDSQYAHLFGTAKPANVDTAPPEAYQPSSSTDVRATASAHASSSTSSREDRIAQLEQDVQSLRAELEELKRVVLSQ